MSSRTRILQFIVPGRPAPFVRATGKQYKIQSNPAIGRYMDYRTSVGEYAEFAGAEPVPGAVDVEVTCYLQKPHWNYRRWDVENVLKAVNDGMNGVAFGDDKQVRDATIRVRRAPATHEARFLYACDEWTDVTVWTVDGDPWEAHPEETDGKAQMA